MMNMSVIKNQPGGGATAVVDQWMALPAAPVDCPPGLEYLCMVDQLLCHQKVELLEAFTGWETENKYAIKNAFGQQIYYAFEKSDVFMRLCCSNNRKFTIHIVNNYNQEVMRIRRPLKCCAGTLWCFANAADCCAQELVVEAPPGNAIGYVRQTASACALKYDICDAYTNQTQLKIEGPCWMCRCCADVDFPVYTSNGSTRVGCVTKQWNGLTREVFTDADHFGIKFPIDLDVKLKATLIGALFLIDFMVYENHQML